MTTVSTIGVTMDCPDPDVAAAFWETFLSYNRRPTTPDSPYVTIERPEGSDGIALVTFQRVPEPKTTKARVHLDLFVDHAQPMFDAMIAAGATAVHTIPAQEWTTRVLTDPAGNEFCLISIGERRRRRCRSTVPLPIGHSVLRLSRWDEGPTRRWMFRRLGMRVQLMGVRSPIR